MAKLSAIFIDVRLYCEAFKNEMSPATFCELAVILQEWIHFRKLSESSMNADRNSYLMASLNRKLDVIKVL